MAEAQEFTQLFMDYLDLADDLLAAANWENQDPVWLDAMADWRDEFHVLRGLYGIEAFGKTE